MDFNIHHCNLLDYNFYFLKAYQNKQTCIQAICQREMTVHVPAGSPASRFKHTVMSEMAYPSLPLWFGVESLLMRVKEENEKAGLKFNMKKPKIMASGSITSWQIEGEIGEVTNFVFLSSQITADGDCSHEIKRHLLFERKAMTNLDSLFKRKDITLPKRSV